MGHHHAAYLLVALVVVLFDPAQQRSGMPGPQGLSRMAVEFFWDLVLLPALDDFQRPAVGGEDGVA
ncbi:hypothetical protein D3C86_1878500 [compost metagenome]